MPPDSSRTGLPPQSQGTAPGRRVGPRPLVSSHAREVGRVVVPARSPEDRRGRAREAFGAEGVANRVGRDSVAKGARMYNVHADVAEPVGREAVEEVEASEPRSQRRRDDHPVEVFVLVALEGAAEDRKYRDEGGDAARPEKGGESPELRLQIGDLLFRRR